MSNTDRFGFALFTVMFVVVLPALIAGSMIIAN